MWHKWRSLLRQWFFGFTGPEPLVLGDRDRLLLFVGLVVPAFALAWPLHYLIAPVYNTAVALLAQLLLAASGRPIEVASDASTVVFRSSFRPRFEADFSLISITGNAPFLWVLLLMTPGMNLSRRLRVFLAGSLLLLATHAAFATVKIGIALVETGHPTAGNAAIWGFLDDFFEIAGRGFFPVAIWIPLTYEYLRGRVDPRVTKGLVVGRNKPCPCGSGRKFKHCCGRS